MPCRRRAGTTATGASAAARPALGTASRENATWPTRLRPSAATRESTQIAVRPQPVDQVGFRLPPKAARLTAKIASRSPGLSGAHGDRAGHVSRAPAASRAPAQEFVGRHRLPAGGLDLEEAHGAPAAGDRARSVEERAGRARAVGERGAQDLHALGALAEIRGEEGARERRQPADPIVHGRAGLPQSIRASAFVSLCA